MKRVKLTEITSRMIRQYVREKVRGYAERQAERVKVRREGKQAKQERLFE